MASNLIYSEYFTEVTNSIIYGTITKKAFNLFKILVKNCALLSISNSPIFNKLFYNSYTS